MNTTMICKNALSQKHVHLRHVHLVKLQFEELFILFNDLSLYFFNNMSVIFPFFFFFKVKSPVDARPPA